MKECFVGVLMIATWAASAGAGDIKEGDKLQTLSDLHPDKQEIHAINYQLPGRIPVCADITVKKVSKKAMVFRLLRRRIPVRVGQAYEWRRRVIATGGADILRTQVRRGEDEVAERRRPGGYYERQSEGWHEQGRGSARDGSPAVPCESKLGRAGVDVLAQPIRAPRC